MFLVDLQVVPTENSKLHEKDDSVYDIDDEAADRFFESFREPYGLEKDSIAVDGSCKCNLKKIVQDKIQHLQITLEEPMRVLCHRHPDRFWRILFKQKIGFSVNDTSVTWSGEAGADGGGLYREFLLRSMENFLDSTLFFGKKGQAFFNCVPQDIMDKKYKMLGQIKALSILYINRGPECLHQSAVNSLFSTNNKNLILTEEQFDGELKVRVEELKRGDNSCLLDANIRPVPDISENIKMFCNYFCVISKASAMHQYKEGIVSISTQILQCPCCFMRYFTTRNKPCSLREVRENLKFIRSEEGTHIHDHEEDAISEFEFFLVSLEEKNNNFKVKDFLQFVAAVDRVPVTGFTKPIQVYFVGEHIFPKVSTCGVTLALPLNITCDI